jgi:hypothetical protein
MRLRDPHCNGFGLSCPNTAVFTAGCSTAEGVQLRLSQGFERAEFTLPQVVVEQRHEIACRFIVDFPKARHDGAGAGSMK